jgi:NAD(P)-dependent dehydrogenase (short-subunit alcohol dehydrogenase family)
MLNLDLSNRSILLTGGLGAIAKSVIDRLLQANANLVITDVVPHPRAIEQLRSYDLPADSWTYFECDVTRENAVISCFQSLFDSGAMIDCMIGLAGGCALHTFLTMSIDEYRKIFDYNYYGHVLPCKAITDLWVKHNIPGHAIFTSSLVGQLPWNDLSAYSPAKAAIEQLAKCLALEFAPHGIRFNCVAPGHVATGSCLKVYDEDATYRALVDSAIPLRRLVRPEAIADAFVWLCSSMGDDVNGQVIHVDCGASIPKVG